MALRAIVTDINSVDETFRSHYAEKDGKFVLDVEPVDGFKLENITGLTNALGAERHTRSTLEDRLKTYGDLDPNAARDALTRLNDYADLDPAAARKALADVEKFSKFNPEQEADRIAEEKFNRSKTQLSQQFEKREGTLTEELKGLKDTLSKREKQVEKLLKENAIKVELSKHNPLADAADVLERIISDNVRLRDVDGSYIVEVVDEKGVPRIKDYNGTPLTVADYIAELREKRASLFQPDKINGTGFDPKQQSAPPNTDSGKNPWVKGPGFSLTRQMVLVNTDPNTAKRLMQEAGVA